MFQGRESIGFWNNFESLFFRKCNGPTAYANFIESCEFEFPFAKNMLDHVIEDAEHDEHGPEAIWTIVDGPIHVKKFA